MNRDGYIIVAKETEKRLSVEVNEWMEKGYIPQGGIAILHNRSFDAPCFYQAMVLDQFLHHIKGGE